MAFDHGRKSVIMLDNSGGTPVDISAFATDVAMPRSVDMAEVSVFGNDTKQYIAGLEDGTISISGPYDPVIDAQIDGVIVAIRTGTLATASFQYDPQGSTMGLPRYDAECLVTSYDPPTSMSDAVRYSLDLQVTNGITRTTVP